MKKMNLMLMSAVLACAGGCGVLDAIDGKLREIGALPPKVYSDEVDLLAIVSIQAGDQKGVGVVVADKMVFTPYHVVRNSGYIMVQFFGNYRSGYHKEVEARIIYRNPTLDQCILYVDTETPHVIPMGMPSEGKALMVSLSKGEVNRFGQCIGYPCLNSCTTGSDTYTASSITREGDSGSPIIQAGKVIGLVRGPTMMVSVKRTKGMSTVIGS